MSESDQVSQARAPRGARLSRSGQSQAAYAGAIGAWAPNIGQVRPSKDGSSLLMRALGILASLAVALPSTTSAAGRSQEDAGAARRFERLPEQQGVALGIGFDALKLDLKLSALTGFGTTLSTYPPICYFDKKYDLAFVDSREDLLQKIGVTAAATIDVIVAQARGEVSYAASVITNESDIHLLIQDTRYNCDYTVRLPVFTDEAARLFQLDEAAFRRAHGDRYLATVTTGGRFYAVLRIHGFESRMRDEIVAKLKAKVLGVTVFSLEYRRVFEEIMGSPDTQAELHIRKGDGQTIVAQAAEFFEYYNRYLEEVTGPACNGSDANGYLTCPHRTYTYAPYGSPMLPARSSLGIQDRVATLNKLGRHWVERRAFVERVRQIERNPSAYEARAVGSDVAELKRRLLVDVEALTEAMKQCEAAPPAQCEEPRLSMNSLDMEYALPRRRGEFPRDCADVQRRYKVKADGEFAVYLAGDQKRPFRLYCSGMDTADPQGYLTLQNTSARSAAPTYNFGKYKNLTDAHDGHVGDLISVYEKIRVTVHEDHLEVWPGQTNFVQTAGGSFVVGLSKTDRAAYGSGQLCNYLRTRVTNIDLSGTNWAVKADIATFIDGNRSPANDVMRSTNGQVLEVFARALEGCVTVQPIGVIRLEYLDSPGA